MIQTVFSEWINHLCEENITNHAWWQIAMILLTALISTMLAYYFSDRSKRKARMVTSKGVIRRFGYELQQAYSNRLQSELNSNYYELLYGILKSKEDKKFFREMAKEETLNIPKQSIEISWVYGRLMEQLSILEQLASSKSFEQIGEDADKLIFNHKSIIVRPATNISNKELADKYLSDGKESIEYIIDDEIRKSFDIFADELKNVRLRFL